VILLQLLALSIPVPNPISFVFPFPLFVIGGSPVPSIGNGIPGIGGEERENCGGVIGDNGISCGVRIGWMCGIVWAVVMVDLIMSSGGAQYDRAERDDTEGTSWSIAREKRLGKRERRSGRMVARPAARRATPGSTVDHIATV
jgi:hypothetical protein